MRIVCVVVVVGLVAGCAGTPPIDDGGVDPAPAERTQRGGGDPFAVLSGSISNVYRNQRSVLRGVQGRPPVTCEPNLLGTGWECW